MNSKHPEHAANAQKINTRNSLTMIQEIERYHLIKEEKQINFNGRILYEDDNIREVLITDKQSIAKSYLLTMKNKEWLQNKEICEAQESIQNGEAIAKAFKANGYTVHKNVLDVYTANIPEWLQMAFNTKIKTAKSTIAECIVWKNDTIYNYGFVTEICSPVFSEPKVDAIDQMRIGIPSPSLLKLGFNNEEIWASLEHKTLSPDLARLYSPIVKEIKERIYDILMDSLSLLSVY